MKSTLIKFTRLMVGFWFCAVGIVLTINAQLGLSPWDVLHEGINIITGITMGQASILIGIIVVIIDMILGENLGWGTIINMVVVGVLMDFLMLNNLIPLADSFFVGIVMMCLGMLSMGFGCTLYLGAGLGSGPRDGMMVAIHKKTGYSIRIIRTVMEVSALIIGYVLGGTVGIGTLISALGLGYFMQFTFKVCKFDSAKVEHRFIIDDIDYIKDIINMKKIKTEADGLQKIKEENS